MEFEPGSEQYLAAVLYVARDAKEQWEKHGRRGGKWWYLNRVRRALGLEEPINMSYHAMRAELLDFAESFGVVGVAPNRAANRAARDIFDKE